jgi:hypothetical protein
VDGFSGRNGAGPGGPRQDNHRPGFGGFQPLWDQDIAMTRECGDCSLCCKVLRIPELEKPRHEWCPHIVLKRGCGIYDDRPPSCRNFVCLWLLDERFDEQWKPSKCKMVMVAERPHQIVIYVDKGANQPWMKEPYFSILRDISSRGYDVGGIVTVSENGETIVILPDRGENLGALKPDDRILLRKASGPGGRIEVRVVKADQVERLQARPQKPI